MQQQQPQGTMGTLIYRVETVEREIVQIKTQLGQYEPTTLSDLKLQQVIDAIKRVEADQHATRDKLEMMHTAMISVEAESKKRDAEMHASLYKLQIRFLISIVSTILTCLTLLLVAYFTHIIH